MLALHIKAPLFLLFIHVPLSNISRINCAGIEGVRPLLDVDMEWAKQVYDVNVWGPLAVTQAFAPLIIEAKGIIANLSSIGCEIPVCWAGN